MATKANPIKAFKHEMVTISELTPHPKNYREHSEDQIEHLINSVKEHGFYRNVVIAKDSVILAGHGVVLACKKMGKKKIPVVRLNVPSDDPKALKVLTGDNEIGRLAGINDRALSELLKEIKETDVDGLLGTGYDDQRLAALAFVTRPQSEIEDFDAAAEWAGADMPEFGGMAKTIKIVVLFRSQEDREAFYHMVDTEGLQPFTDQTRSLWWPPKEREDLASVKFEG